MHDEVISTLDSHWAAHLHCEPSLLRNHDTNIVTDPDRKGAEVWLFDKTCVMIAEPDLARALKTSVGSRNPVVAFEPSRLRDAVEEYGLEVFSPEAVMAYSGCEGSPTELHWIPASETDTELAAAAQAAPDSAIPMVAIPLNRRPARRAAEASGFKLYASVIYIGHRPETQI
jgi:hypothetical protein